MPKRRSERVVRLLALSATLLVSSRASRASTQPHDVRDLPDILGDASRYCRVIRIVW